MKTKRHSIEMDHGTPRPTITPAEQGIIAARREAGFDALRGIEYELQTWQTALLLEMEQYTHHEGQWLIRVELANRGVGTDGRWVGFPEAEKIWKQYRLTSEEEGRFYQERPL